MEFSYTEDEIKQILKKLFAEKKRVQELEKQLAEINFEEKKFQKKFYTTQEDIDQCSLTEEYAKLKRAYFEKEKEVDHFKRQLEKVRPTLKKLIHDLKHAQAELEKIKKEPEHDSPRT